MDKRKKRALRITLVLAALLSIPLGTTYYFYQRDLALHDFTPYPVKPFYVNSDKGGGFTEHQLRQKVSLIAIIPSDCVACAEQPSPFEVMEAWAAKNLSYEGMGKVPYLLVAMGPFDRAFAQSLPPVWLTVSLSAAGSPQNLDEAMAAFGRGLLQSDHREERQEAEKLRFLFVDEQAQVRGGFEWDGASLNRVTRHWSKLTFNSYLNDYLSKRTFFGVKKNLR